MHGRLLAFGGSGLRVRRLGGNRAGEIRLTRWLRNEAVSVQEMVDSAAARTALRCVGVGHVLAIQDTTVVRSSGGGGLYLHPVIAVDGDDGALLGIVSARFLSRTSGKKATYKTKPVSEKESQRWLDGADDAARICAAAAKVTVIADREGDIFSAFARAPAGCDLIVRAAKDRCLDDGGRLFAHVDKAKVAGRAELEIGAIPGRVARSAELAVRFEKVSLKRPSNAVERDLPATVDLMIVDVREETPPAGITGVHWRLLTTHTVETADDAIMIADLYRRRWQIEQVFRTLKTKGFDIEGVLIEDEAPLKRLTLATLIAAVSIQQLVHARDGASGQGSLRPMTDAFEPEDHELLAAFTADLEGKTARQKNPHPPSSLAWAAWVCARLGGWTGYYGKPGPIVMLNGWKHFQKAKHAVGMWIQKDV